MFGWVVVLNTGDNSAASAPQVDAQRSPVRECAATVINQRFLCRHLRASVALISDRWMPEAPIFMASSGSPAINNFN